MRRATAHCLQAMPAAAHTAVLCGVAVLLAGCASPQVQGFTDAISSGLSSGAQKSSLAATPGPDATAEPTEKKTAGSSAATLTKSSGKVEAAATFEGDLTCSTLVAPFEATQNVAALAELVGSSSLNVVGDMVKNVASGGAGAAGASIGPPKHKIPMQVRAAALRMNWLPMNAEVMYGREALKKMDEMVARDSSVGRRLYPLADAMLAELLKSIQEPHAYKFEIFIRPGSGENAGALPGGLLLMDAALLQDPALRDKAYFALAHEIGHVLQRHETRALQARFIDTMSLMGTVQNMVHQIRTVNANPMPLINLALGGKAQFHQHFSSQELHSDGCAVRILDQAWANNQRLGSVLQSYMAGLVRNHPEESKVATPVANRSVPAGLQPLATRVNQASEEVLDIMAKAQSPMDSHPAPKERIDNLKLTMGQVVSRIKPTAAADTKAAVKAAPPKVPPAKTGK
jgi:Zn-dependent protease with chaperone function